GGTRGTKRGHIAGCGSELRGIGAKPEARGMTTRTRSGVWHAEVALLGLTPITMTEALSARFGGRACRSIRWHRTRTATTFRMPNARQSLGVTIFYYEATGSTEVESNGRARTIMNSVSVRR